jgi:hypothetical protein
MRQAAREGAVVCDHCAALPTRQQLTVLHRKRADRSEAPYVLACISSPVRLGAIFDQRYRSRFRDGEQLL